MSSAAGPSRSLPASASAGLPSTLGSPAESSASPQAPKRKHSGKGKAKHEDDGSGSEDEEGRKRNKRNRMALSCRECKRRKCDRSMPVCGQCDKRGKPSDCTWDILSNEAALPTTIARTTDLEAVSARLAHVEAYLKTLPPNLTSFIPYIHQSSTPSHSTDVHRSRSTGARGVDKEETFSDTEDAAVHLENGVFGRAAAFPENGITRSPEIHGSKVLKGGGDARFAGGRGDASGREIRFGGRPLELTKALTSIVGPGANVYTSRVHLNVDFNASPADVERERGEAFERIYRALPLPDVVDHLVQLYFTQVSWLFHHLHAPSFLVELEAFHEMVTSGRSQEVDLLWIALLLMVICVALDSTHTSRSPLSLVDTPVAPTPLSRFTDEELRTLPEVWFQASQAALALGEWETIPRVRSIQTIILYTQYLQLCSSNRGQPSQLVTWLAGAIRLATVLGLNLLGSNPEIMPGDDPAWPPGKNSLKREAAKRLWGVLVYQDWIGASSKNRSYLISPLHFDTDDPGNLNDADLSPSDWKVDSLPSNILTDSTSDRIRIALARQVRKVFDAVVMTKNFTYETVLELDRGYHTILESLPDRWTLEVSAEETEQPMLRYQRHFALEGLHNRIFRLHRPFSTRGYSQPKYRFSTDACIKSARVVIVSTHNIFRATRDIWWIYSHVMGATLVLFNDLFQAIDHDLPAAEIDAKKDTLLLASQIFSGSDEITTPSLKNVVETGSRIIQGLFRAEEARRVGRAAQTLISASSGVAAPEDDEVETFAEVLQRISRSLNNRSAPHTGTPPPTRNIPLAGGFRPPASTAVDMPMAATSEVAPSQWEYPSLPSAQLVAGDLSLQFFQEFGAVDSSEELWPGSSFMMDLQPTNGLDTFGAGPGFGDWGQGDANGQMGGLFEGMGASNASYVNGHGANLIPSPSKTLSKGVYAPLNAFYHPGTEDLDLDTFKKHAVRIAEAGVGLVANGSMGEAVHLTHSERNAVVAAAREALDSNNLKVPLIAGTGACSTRETIEFTVEAAKAGADYAMVISPGYFAGALGRDALKAYFVDVAAKSPIPVIIYNFPGASSGIDLDSDLIAEIAAAAPNICGVKLTCGSVGKLTRLVSLREDFGVLGGFVDFLGPSLLLNSAGCITGTANVAPKSCRKLYELTLSGLAGSATDLQKGVALQEIVSAGDWALQKGGISGTKYALEQAFGYGGVPRKPILPYKGDGAKLMNDLKALLDYEKAL
ncbi:Zn(2)-C6 fungal-type transcription factor [Pseudohyphozyma bogoriensis]|nr:Zn(2)-C6 fungal-type transcription factor [Pseudohyphozyma bogoriensis]